MKLANKTCVDFSFSFFIEKIKAIVNSNVKMAFPVKINLRSLKICTKIVILNKSMGSFMFYLATFFSILFDSNLIA